MKKNLKLQQANNLYFLLGGLFIASLIVCNLIANKFISVDLGFKVFIISAGVLPYPITFLITDILSEIYGRKKTNKVVYSGFVASFFVLGILWLGNQFNAIPDSPVDDYTYAAVFKNSWRVIMASMIAYLSAQLVDVRLFHFWKKLTKGKHLWLRNNGSTILSQLLDTTLVVGVLFFGVKSTNQMIDLIIDGWMFKALCALLDTPIFYGLVKIIQRYFMLKPNQELTD
jgi:uncharacterized integral membrane protein (TIGR00697 family)